MTAWKNKLLAISLLALVTGLVIHTGGIAGSARIPMHPQVAVPDSTQVGLIYQLQAAFHRAKTNQDIELMMSLWDASATLTVQGNANQTFVGSQQIRSFWETSGSFTHRRFSLVPSFKTQIDVHGDEAWLYFECHDVGDYDLPDRSIASDTFLAGTVRNVGGKWVFSGMTAGKAFPLSVNHFYFP